MAGCDWDPRPSLSSRRVLMKVTHFCLSAAAKQRNLSVYLFTVETFSNGQDAVYQLFDFTSCCPVLIYFTFQKPKYTIISQRTPWNIAKVDSLLICFVVVVVSLQKAPKQTILDMGSKISTPQHPKTMVDSTN